MAWVCFMRSVLLSAGTWPTFVTSTQCKIGLMYQLTVERRCDGIWRSCHESCDEIPQAFSLHFCVLQAIKNWRCRKPANEASAALHCSGTTTPTFSVVHFASTGDPTSTVFVDPYSMGCVSALLMARTLLSFGRHYHHHVNNNYPETSAKNWL